MFSLQDPYENHCTLYCNGEKYWWIKPGFKLRPLESLVRFFTHWAISCADIPTGWPSHSSPFKWFSSSKITSCRLFYPVSSSGWSRNWFDLYLFVKKGINKNWWYIYNIQVNIRPCFVFYSFALVVSRHKFKTGWIPISLIISLKTQLCLGKFKAGQKRLQVKGKNNTGRK